jgi:hypothetical protein
MPTPPAPATDPVEQMICRWAEATYDLVSVTAVEFDMQDDGAWSDETPGEGPYMRVTITYLGKQGAGSQKHMRTDTVYDTNLIREILKFALSRDEQVEAPPDDPPTPPARSAS